MKKKNINIQQQILDFYSKKRSNSIKNHQSPVKKTSKIIQKIHPQPQSNFQEFLAIQKKIAHQQQPLQFRQLPRKLKVYFPHDPIPPPQLKPIPYTYEIVKDQPVKMPKRKPCELSDWVYQSMGWKSEQKKSVAQKYKFTERGLQLAKKFQKNVRKIIEQVKSNKISVKDIYSKRMKRIEPYQYYNSKQFFTYIKDCNNDAQKLLMSNNGLAYDFDEQHLTPLHWSARVGNIHLLKLLLQKYSANVNVKDNYGRTPLHHAVMNKKLPCIYRLFVEGGNLNAEAENKKTVKDVAPDMYTKYVLEKLEELKFLVNPKNKSAHSTIKQQLQKMIRQSLDPLDSYF